MTANESKQLKEELLENISDLFLKYGLRSTSMEDICTHLKISKKTLYQLFSNKDDIVEQVMVYRRNNYHTQQQLKKLRQLDAIHMMLNIRDHIIENFNSRLPANLFDLKKYHPEVYKKANKIDQESIQALFNEIINKGIQEGNFRSSINQEVQVYLFVKQMLILSEPELISEIKYPIATIVSTIVENTLRSFVTPQGQKILEELT
ncbi:MAG: TetR/AcrR family transcriptional regulator [Odoribacter sp.]|nr:TetR/AcrR family transcriptional regulator [Odoribacter sp.]